MPAAAVKPAPRGVPTLIGPKASVARPVSPQLNPAENRWTAADTTGLGGGRSRRNSRGRGKIRRSREDHQWRRRPARTRPTVRDESWGSEPD